MILIMIYPDSGLLKIICLCMIDIGKLLRIAICKRKPAAIKISEFPIAFSPTLPDPSLPRESSFHVPYHTILQVLDRLPHYKIEGLFPW